MGKKNILKVYIRKLDGELRVARVYQWLTCAYQWVKDHSAVIGVIIALVALAASYFTLFQGKEGAPGINISGDNAIFEDVVVVGNNNMIFKKIADEIAVNIQTVQLSIVNSEVSVDEAELFSKVDTNLYSEYLSEGIAPIVKLREGSSDEYRDVYDSAILLATKFGDVSRVVLILEEVIDNIQFFDVNDETFKLAKLYRGLGALTLMSDMEKSIQYFSDSVEIQDDKNSLKILEQLLSYSRSNSSSQSPSSGGESNTVLVNPSLLNDLDNIDEGNNTLQTEGNFIVLPTSRGELQDVYTRNSSVLRSFFNLESYIEGGTVRGYKVTSSESSLLELLGLLQGDVIRSVDNTEINSTTKGYDALGDILMSNNLEFVIDRDGVELNVIISGGY